MHGYTPGRFSFNVKGDRCEACEGDGVKRVEMHFLPDVNVPCEVCHGRRPEGGDGGGRIIAEGTPEQVAAVNGSYTGRFLGPLLPKATARRAAAQPKSSATENDSAGSASEASVSAGVTARVRRYAPLAASGPE